MNATTGNFTSTEADSSSGFIIKDSSLIAGFRFGLLSFTFVFGVPIHSYVLWLIVRGRRISSEFVHVNLTVCELIYTLVVFFYIFQLIQSLHSLQRFLQGLGVTGRPLFQCLISIERYLAVVHPVIFLKTKPLRYRLTCCILVWILTVVSCLLSLVMLTTSTQLKVYIWFFSVEFLLFLCIQMFCLVSVLRALKQSGPGERRREKEEENHMKRRAFHLILITTITMVIMFAPFIIIGFLAIHFSEQKDFSVYWYFCLYCFNLGGFVQPVLYLHNNRKLICCSS